jgi:hypothetical protein
VRRIEDKFDLISQHIVDTPVLENIESFKKVQDGIRFYKLHGSILWRQTKEGEYVKYPIYDTGEIIPLSSGMEAKPVILYPGKKLEYSEPAIDMLVVLKNQLKCIEYAFVIGYSFKDGHIIKTGQKFLNW